MVLPHISGKVQSVLGLIEPDALGVTMPHEHILTESSVFFVEPTMATDKVLAFQPVTLQNLGWIRMNYRRNLDNSIVTDEETAIDELLLYKRNGGISIVDCTAKDMKRDPEALARIARATGLNVIMGTAYYVDIAHPKEMEDWTQGQIATEFITEITTGVEGTGIRAGIIGEIGCSWPLTKNELKVLRAAAVAQQKTGAALMIHPGPNDDSILEITDILRSAGADLNRTVIAHVSQRLRDHKNRVRVAELGCYIEYDFFGRDGFYNLAAPWVSDAQCIDEIRKLISEGYEKQILISHDVGWKIQLTRYGGFGYGYILRYVVPWMRREGISEKQIHLMLVENPRKILQFP